MSPKITGTCTHRGRFPRLVGLVVATGIGLGLVLIGALPANAATTDWSLLSTITVGSGPGGVAFSPNGTHAYVTTDSDGTVSVIALSISPTITPLTAPNGTDTTAYSFQLTATGTATISYSVSSGALPTGVTLDPTTGLISGNPTTPGTYTFQITADNGHAPADTHNYTVATARSVRLSTPAGPPLLPPPAAAARFSGSCSRASVLPHSSAAWFADFALDDNEGYRQADER